MDKINWLQVLVGFVSGGAFGALIKQFFDYRRNRIQPIGYLIKLKSVYNSRDTKLVETQIILDDGTKMHNFSNLYTGTIEIINTGLTDFSTFSFGLTSANFNKFIHCVPTSPDRHHIVEISNEPTFENNTSSFDITLKPFNRKDRYYFDFLLTTSNTYFNPENCIDISTSMPVKLKNVSTGEVISKSFKSIVKEFFCYYPDIF